MEPVLGAALFTLDKVDVAPLISTITSNAPIIIGAGITVILVKKAVPLVPQLINRIIK
ncbi:hypothetical protein [Lysinibacillus sp. FSL K6-0102]|uniref:hypothetical protein n=1 Tax=Lysinibacillus sp. FSL K6-0102 TaxID=2975290 RepID=UPI0030F679E7